MSKKGKINGLQARFAQEYVLDLNPTQAAIRAGYSERTAHTNGYRLLRLPAVAEAVRIASTRKLEALAEQAITADRVLQEFARIAKSDIRKVMSKDGLSILPMDEWSDEAAAAVSSVKVTRGRATKEGDIIQPEVVEFRLWDKLAALTALAKNLGILIDKSEVSSTIKYGWIDSSDEPTAPDPAPALGPSTLPGDFVEEKDGDGS